MKKSIITFVFTLSLIMGTFVSCEEGKSLLNNQTDGVVFKPQAVQSFSLSEGKSYNMDFSNMEEGNEVHFNSKGNHIYTIRRKGSGLEMEIVPGNLENNRLLSIYNGEDELIYNIDKDSDPAIPDSYQAKSQPVVVLVALCCLKGNVNVGSSGWNVHVGWDCNCLSVAL